MQYDVIIVGQGLAGSALSWALLQRGARVLVADRGAGGTASSVAAGLVTPATGRALGQPAHFQRDRAAAAKHYREVEDSEGQAFWFERPALRLFPTEEDARRLATRRADLEHDLADASPAPAAGFRRFADAALMRSAARLDVPKYVDAVRDQLSARESLRKCEICPSDIEPESTGVHIKNLGARARYVVLCGGSDDRGNPWLADSKLNPAKGEIITVTIDDFHEQRTTHSRGYWLLPADEPGVYRFGATYDHGDHDPAPTRDARTTLETALTKLVDRSFRVVDQQAGLRPVGPGRQVLVGAHPVHGSVVLFNGLGSRGVLWAPWQAERLAEQLMSGPPVRALEPA
ncbi:MAG: NAD(P)/FAD-dependent oxidoreductase [Gammaproteobacteria bacterium]